MSIGKDLLNQYSNEELIDELSINRGFYVVTPDQKGAADILDFVVDTLHYTEILPEISDNCIVNYLKDSDYIVIDKDDYDFETELLSSLGIEDNGGNLYKSDCIALFLDLINKNGADFVYALLEPHKTL